MCGQDGVESGPPVGGLGRNGDLPAKFWNPAGDQAEEERLWARLLCLRR